MNPLFVCQANVCRSQFGEAYYDFFTESRDAWSAGVEDYSDRYPSLPQMMYKLAAEKDESGKSLDLSGHFCKPLTREMVELSDRVFVMCGRSQCPSYLAKSSKAVFWDVPDPVGYTYDQTRVIRNQIRDLVRSILPPSSGKNRKV